MRLPVHIETKIEKLGKRLDEAYRLKSEIEKWAEKQGIDTCDSEWYESVVDESSQVSGISMEGLVKLLEDAEYGER